MACASATDRASRSSFVTTKVSPARHAAQRLTQTRGGGRGARHSRGVTGHVHGGRQRGGALMIHAGVPSLPAPSRDRMIRTPSFPGWDGPWQYP